MNYDVQITPYCKNKLKNFGLAEKRKIKRFMDEFSKSGFQAIDSYTIQGYKVRNKSSDDVNKNDADFIKIVKYALTHKLWHYHAGFYNLNNEYPIDNGYKLSDKNDLVSQWLIHYQKLSDTHLVLVDIMPHPPLNLLKIELK
jgi:hypothetical protein